MIEYSDDKFFDRKELDVTKKQNKAEFYKLKYQSSLEKNEILAQKLEDMNENLWKMQKDHNELKGKILKNEMNTNSKSATYFIQPGQRFHCARSLNGSPVSEYQERIEKLSEKN